ncbi:hypothetical protein [Streptomyces sp. NPDC087212]|uniref:hypothetical protein n=1 Tax=Streptomyces sp. NPDC087212 TaxID=3365766 RepID=UPI0038151DC3
MPANNRRANVNAQGAQGVQVGNHNTQHNTFVIRAGALAVVAVVGVALTFTYQNWDGGTEKTASTKATSSADGSERGSGWGQLASRTPMSSNTGDADADADADAETSSPTASPTPTPAPSPTPSPSPSFDAGTLDDAATDRTPVSVAALLPDSFTDAKGVRYARNGGGVGTCGTFTTNVQATAVLARAGCSSDKVVTGTYVDADDRVLVSVEVLALADRDTAVAAHGRLEHDNTGGWRYRCPTVGTGAGVCQRGEALSRATQNGYTGSKYRYLVSTLAVYIDLRQDAGGVAWLTAAAYRACEVAGPANYPGNR